LKDCDFLEKIKQKKPTNLTENPGVYIKTSYLLDVTQVKNYDIYIKLKCFEITPGGVDLKKILSSPRMVDSVLL